MRSFSSGRRRIRLLIAGVALAATLLPSLAAACARDGIPSVSANGRLAVLNRTTGQVVVSSWSPFVFSGTALHGHAISLTENNAEIVRSHVLPHDAFAHPWRWGFGDHTRFGAGTTVRHTYAKPGTYRITVLFYYPPYGAWQPFDDVTIHVR